MLHPDGLVGGGEIGIQQVFGIQTVQVSQEGLITVIQRAILIGVKIRLIVDAVVGAKGITHTPEYIRAAGYHGNAVRIISLDGL